MVKSLLTDLYQYEKRIYMYMYMYIGEKIWKQIHFMHKNYISALSLLTGI